MNMEFDILLAGQPAGKAAVRREGLYYIFDCRCHFTGEVMYRLTVSSGGHTENLGIPVPEGGAFVLRTRLPAKRLGEGKMELRAVPRHAELGEHFIPLSPEEPFRYLRRLENAFLQVRSNAVGVVLREDQSSSTESD